MTGTRMSQKRTVAIYYSSDLRLGVVSEDCVSTPRSAVRQRTDHRSESMTKCFPHVVCKHTEHRASAGSRIKRRGQVNSNVFSDYAALPLLLGLL